MVVAGCADIFGRRQKKAHHEKDSKDRTETDGGVAHKTTIAAEEIY